MIAIIVICMGFLLAAPVLADEQEPPTINLPPVTVMNTPLASAALPKLTEPLLNSPQTIIEVPAQQAIDQGAFNMEDALRYVPGVNIHANEDTSQRNQFYIRGFSAESDRYLDGMLEIGNWYLDTFNMERLEVLEGPAGVLFGRGSTGGVVNYVSKAPGLSPLTEIGTSFGTDGTKGPEADPVVHARYADLTILGQLDPDRGETEWIRPRPERVGLAAGRPVLVIPYAGHFENLGRRVVIAWNATREAARAVADAMPLLASAELVTVLTIDPREGPDAHGEVPGADIAAHLALHGVTAQIERTVSGGLPVGEVLLSRIADLGADLLVMGLYGHSRARELLLGGATRTLLRSMTLPVLMSH
jgi:nucleotide-binding universal stress UspA family protein